MYIQSELFEDMGRFQFPQIKMTDGIIGISVRECTPKYKDWKLNEKLLPLPRCEINIKKILIGEYVRYVDILESYQLFFKEHGDETSLAIKENRITQLFQSKKLHSDTVLDIHPGSSARWHFFVIPEGWDIKMHNIFVYIFTHHAESHFGGSLGYDYRPPYWSLNIRHVDTTIEVLKDDLWFFQTVQYSYDYDEK